MSKSVYSIQTGIDNTAYRRQNERYSPLQFINPPLKNIPKNVWNAASNSVTKNKDIPVR